MLFGKKKRVLALGGGGARGLANIGVLKVLEQAFAPDRPPFDMVIGTSIGSLIGAAYALGISPEELEKKARKFSWPSIVDLGIHSTGLIKGDKLENIISEMIEYKGFEDLKVPFAVTTTDIENGEELTYTSGDLSRLIRASCSWPGIFCAVEVEGRLLVDGGVRNSIPTKAAYTLGADVVLAVNPGFAVKKDGAGNLLEILIQSVQIMGEELNSYQSTAADMMIKPDLEGIDQFDFGKAEEIIRQGEISTARQITGIKKKLSRWW